MTDTTRKLKLEIIDAVLHRHAVNQQPHIQTISDTIDELDRRALITDVDTIAAKDKALDELLAAYADVKSMLAADLPGEPDEDSIGWVGGKPMPVTFGQLRRFHKAIAQIEAMRK